MACGGSGRDDGPAGKKTDCNGGGFAAILPVMGWFSQPWVASPASFAARQSAATPEKCRCATRGKSSPCPFGASGSKSSPPGPRSRKGPRKVTDAMVRAAQLDRSRRQGQALSAAISVVRAPVVVLSHDSCILPPPTGGPVRLPERRKHVKENAYRRQPFRGNSGSVWRRN